jgi:hypothetical protein
MRSCSRGVCLLVHCVTLDNVSSTTSDCGLPSNDRATNVTLPTPTSYPVGKPRRSHAITPRTPTYRPFRDGCIPLGRFRRPRLGSTPPNRMARRSPGSLTESIQRWCVRQSERCQLVTSCGVASVPSCNYSSYHILLTDRKYISRLVLTAVERVRTPTEDVRHQLSTSSAAHQGQYRERIGPGGGILA